MEECPKIVSPTELDEKLDLYESMREEGKKLAKKDKNNFHLIVSMQIIGMVVLNRIGNMTQELVLIKQRH